jgi:hypothetical protein
VPRFLPRFRGFETPDSIEVRIKGLRTEWRRAIKWIWFPIIAELLFHLRLQPWWPHPLG